MTNFFVLKPDGGRFGTKWAYADQLDPVIRGGYEHCPVCDGPVSMLKWLPPHRIKLSSAKPEKWGDFLWGTFSPLIVSASFKEIYENENLSGIAFFHPPAEIVRIGTRKTGDFPANLPEYYLIEIPWGGANQDDEKSGVVYEYPEKVECPFCRVGSGAKSRQDRIVLEENSWDGSDIFRARGTPAQLMGSERLHAIIEKYALKNVWLIPAEKYSFDARRIGLMHQWFVQD